MTFKISIYAILPADVRKFYRFILFRAISVILGDKWKQLDTTERQQYAEKARILAEEHKKNFPDCWKRKKTLKVNLIQITHLDMPIPLYLANLI